ncbi:MAG: hypothetical protein FWC64_12940 [Treponema sp.]|nr:hypothetical protein [Treponema sp.]
MKRYCINCRAGKIEYFDVITESEDELNIRLTRISGGSERVIEDSMSRQMFDMCFKTGYIFEMENAAASVA